MYPTLLEHQGALLRTE
uniref:Uncharacterized protein n=1 Tax=Rhizophora mucronata TaxID=61149 RepID=A0A2P2R053_RHIMU